MYYAWRIRTIIESEDKMEVFSGCRVVRYIFGNSYKLHASFIIRNLTDFSRSICL